MRSVTDPPVLNLGEKFWKAGTSLADVLLTEKELDEIELGKQALGIAGQTVPGMAPLMEWQRLQKSEIIPEDFPVTLGE